MENDIISPLPASDSAEEASQLAKLFAKLDCKTLTINSRAVLKGFFAMNGMSAKTEEIFAAIVDIPSSGEENVRQRLINEVRMLPCKVETLLDFLSSKGDAAETVFALEQYCGIIKEFDEAVEELKALVLMLFVSGVPSEDIKLELSYPGSSEFTGTVFHIADKSGGRVGDKLIIK